jgi:hypothetical protein
VSAQVIERNGMRVTNRHGLPQVIVDAVLNDPYTGGGDISATKLIDAPQIRVLGGRYKDQITTDVSERVWALLGQALHTVLERAGIRQEGMIAEHRFFAEYNDWTLSGQADVLDLDAGAIRDYKMTTVFKASGNHAWNRQLNVLRWLAMQNGYTITTLEIVAIFRDWRKAEAERNPEYPQAPIQIIDIPLWDHDVLEQYLDERVAMHQAASRGEAVPCSDEERWKDPDRWAVIKPGGGRALRVLDAPPAPEDVPDGYVVQPRPGVYKRCKFYCDVSAWCPQWAADSGTPED